MNKDRKTANPDQHDWLKKYGPDLIGGLIFALTVTFLFPVGRSYEFADLREGRVWAGKEIIAPFTFPVNKSDQEYSADVEKAKQSVLPVFQRDESIESNQLQALQSFLQKLSELLKMPNAKPDEVKALFRESAIVLSEEDINLLMSGFSDQSDQIDITKPPTGNILQNRINAIQSISSSILTLIKELYSVGILNIEKTQLVSEVNKISIRQQGADTFEDLNYYHDPEEAKNICLEKLRTDKALDEKKIKIAYQISTHFLQPNILFDKDETDARIEDAIANVPLAKDQVLANQRIIDSHERITQQHIDQLNSLAIAKAERGEVSGFWARISPYIGKFLLTLLIMSALVTFLWQYRKEILDSRKQLLLLSLTILTICILASVINRFDLSAYLIPVALGAIIVTIFFDTVIGFTTSVVISLLVGAIRGDEYGITFISIFVCSIAIQSVSRVRTRNWVPRSIITIAVSYIISITVHGLVSYTPFSEIFVDWVFGIINGLMATIFAYGLITIMEYLFDMTTDMTLLELSDLNQPLLRQLAMQAPGTYHHSIMVGNLAEAATEAVGGNGLLARVGAYYHDIGKMEKPEYFVENQAKGRNPQEKLTPSMSSLILMNHVRKGSEMAQHHNLPKEIINFINQHHGTALMSYFYQKALEKSSEGQISENEYRYPGPKPTTREIAIVMLADAIEAASRTLKEPTPSRIKGLVEQLIDERFKSGELDNSPLTLQDLSKISETFQKILNGVFHARISYPSSKESGNKRVEGGTH